MCVCRPESVTVDGEPLEKVRGQPNKRRQPSATSKPAPQLGLVLEVLVAGAFGECFATGWEFPGARQGQSRGVC